MTLALVEVFCKYVHTASLFQLPCCFIFSRVTFSLKAKEAPLHLKEWNVKCLGFRSKLTTANFNTDLTFAAIKGNISFLVII